MAWFPPAYSFKAFWRFKSRQRADDMRDPDPLWYDREEPPYSWKETWIDLSVMAAGGVTAYVMFFYGNIVFSNVILALKT